MKIVINKCYGGFGISKEAAEYMASRGHLQAKAVLEYPDGYYCHGYSDKFPDDYSRTDPLLIEAVETLGAKANSSYAELKVVEIPDGVEYTIEEYDGNEWVAEKHRVWS